MYILFLRGAGRVRACVPRRRVLGCVWWSFFFLYSWALLMLLLLLYWTRRGQYKKILSAPAIGCMDIILNVYYLFLFGMSMSLSRITRSCSCSWVCVYSHSVCVLSRISLLYYDLYPIYIISIHI